MFDELSTNLRRFRDERDWGQFHTPRSLAISVSVEAAELLELFQWRSDGEPLSSELKATAAEEAADVLLYLIQFCDSLEIDLPRAAQEKLAKNSVRFPVSSSFGIAHPKDRTKDA